MQGWEGWDDYAPFYDWENAQTLGRRDIAVLAPDRCAEPSGRACWSWVAAPAAWPFRWREPVARSSASIDRRRCWRAPAAASAARGCSRTLRLVRGDIRHLPFPDRAFPLVIAPYGILQSLLASAI